MFSLWHKCQRLEVACLYYLWTFTYFAVTRFRLFFQPFFWKLLVLNVLFSEVWQTFTTVCILIFCGGEVMHASIERNRRWLLSILKHWTNHEISLGGNPVILKYNVKNWFSFICIHHWNLHAFFCCRCYWMVKSLLFYLKVQTLLLNWPPNFFLKFPFCVRTSRRMF